MKKKLLFILFLALSQAVFAQNTFPTESGSNVGIGTLSPTNKLHIVDAAGSSAINLQTATNNLNETIGISFGTQTGPRIKAAVVGLNTNVDNAAGALLFRTNNGTTLAEKMRITSDGFVGVGTTAPTSLLSVGGNSFILGYQQAAIRYSPVITSGTGGMLGLQMMANPTANSTASLFGIYSQMGTETGLSNNIGTMNGIVTSINNRGTGNIGIVNNMLVTTPMFTSTGTVTTSYGLVIHPQLVTNVTTGYGISQLGSTDLNYFAGNVGIGINNPQNKLVVSQSNSVIPGALIRDSGTGNAGLAFVVPGVSFTWGIDQSDSKKFKLSNSSTLGTNDYITITNANGNVGIGTTNPTDKLAVNGTIHTKEVKVDLNGWSDYVFDKTYILPGLNDVETYIQQNHRLPEMPSEKEVVENGLKLGEMNKLLTKKVEELTLYLINQQKQIDELKQQIKSLNK
ncbi:hypothetical protein [Mucilaginibacter phyllosphaerae]|uniref:BZIP transcription factor n=1 Tax=Mucilaginibacter phyllosphaerae TaxID=1812349 RepID=A0A4Y8AAU1_9SPHI|nr:hypothetical protein [Mucilaginibacter phyllosphaerae]MBB3969660.1 hypothetical protein [Mucilaginibacter phyllosphaerae]TEW65045.1 hypothetical protein E2R65_14100 [Mucilaginibacter phyllosphaerae]GGH18325.1 hypothetical protein GCM10007352_28970 [Mucilaginibacter phyllosphaerae]